MQNGNEFVKEKGIYYTIDRETLVKCTSEYEVYFLNIADSVKKIAPEAFRDANDLSEIGLPSSMTEIDSHAFAFANTRQVILPKGLKTIGACAFQNSKITDMVIPESVERIEDNAFDGCNQLHNLWLPNTLQYLGKEAFKGCSVLKSIRLPENISSLLEGTFADCKNLRYIYVPDSVVTIDKEAFSFHSKELVLFGNPGTFVETWAKENGISFCTEPFEEEEYRKDPMYRSKVEDYKKANIGDIVTFGSYLQRGIRNIKDSIEWIVLQREENQLFLISKTLLLKKESDCEMSEWLNQTFLQEAFHDLEKQCLVGKLFYLEQEEKIRPAIWIGVDKISELMPQNNVQYIREWIMEHNDYLAFRAEREEMLDLLTRFVVLFEKVAKLNPEDVVIKEGERIRIVGGPAQTGEEATRILKMINYNYGYLPFDVLKKVPGYSYLHFAGKHRNGVLDDELLYEEFENWVTRLHGQYGTEYQFDRIVYVIKNKVFYADQPLTAEEIEKIEKSESGSQIQYDVDHWEDGSMNWW